MSPESFFSNFYFGFENYIKSWAFRKRNSTHSLNISEIIYSEKRG